MASENYNALQMLSAYESNSSDDEVPSSRVQVKRTLSADSTEQVKKIKSEKLPLPSVFTNSNTSNHVDDPTLHGGRIRSFPHVRGNWSTFIYLPYQGNHKFNELLEKIKALCNSTVQLETVNDFHLSLTKTVILKHHWIDSFVSTIREKIKNSYLRRFLAFFNDIKVYVNEEKTRTFLGINVNTGYDSLIEAVRIFDECLSEFKLERFYKNPTFHMSVLWCLGDKKDDLNNVLPEINNLVKQFIQDHPDKQWYIDASTFICKIGNKQVNFPLL